MAKTFIAGARLLASEINSELNPSTAPHIPYAVAAGVYQGSGTAIATKAYGAYAVYFPAGRFTKAPVVTVTNGAVSAGNASLDLHASNVSAAGFTINAYNPETVTVTPSVVINWTAIQMDA